MEMIRGKVSRELDPTGLHERMAGYKHVVLDLGTGDGRFVRSLAERHLGWFVIGVDTCRENLHEHSRAKTPNMLFIVAAAQKLPWEFDGLVSHITINFPWGSLLHGLLAADTQVLDGIRAISRPIAQIEVRLNGGALAEMGTTLKAGAVRISDNLSRAGWQVGASTPISTLALRELPSTWARRIAVGSDPRGLTLSGWAASQAQSTPVAF
jgi:16S rRNA (adenine(1408)-N(1))-methyltransferase